MSESLQRAIGQVATLFPYLAPAERLDWWEKLGCPLTELTVHMESPSDELKRLLSTPENVEEPT